MSELSYSRSTCPLPLQWFKKHYFVLFTFGSLAVGVGIGIVMKVFNAPPEAAVWLGLPGELFLRALRFCVIPLLSCNIISVSAAINPRTQGKLALLALGYCFVMNITASFVGGFIAFGIKPGSYARLSNDSNGQTPGQQVQISDVLADMFRNMVPENCVNMFLSAVFTSYEPVNSTTNPSQIMVKRVLKESPGVNILGLLVSSLAIGLVAGNFDDEDARPFVSFFQVAAKVLTRLLEKIMLLLPLGMASLVLKAIAELQEAWGTVKALGMFVATSMAFLACIAFVLLPCVYTLAVRRNPFKFISNMANAALTAFSTVSSITALPEIFKCVEKAYGMNPTSARLLGPFLTSFNANGSSAFISSCIMFCAQWSNVQIGTGNLIAIFFLAGINVMALPAVPSSSIVIVLLLLRSFGIPETAVPLLYVPEFINDRMRTVVNVESHAVCLLTVNAYEKRLEHRSASSEFLDDELEEVNEDDSQVKVAMGKKSIVLDASGDVDDISSQASIDFKA